MGKGVWIYQVCHSVWIFLIARRDETVSRELGILVGRHLGGGWQLRDGASCWVVVNCEVEGLWRQWWRGKRERREDGNYKGGKECILRENYMRRDGLMSRRISMIRFGMAELGSCRASSTETPNEFRGWFCRNGRLLGLKVGARGRRSGWPHWPGVWTPEWGKVKRAREEHAMEILYFFLDGQFPGRFWFLGNLHWVSWSRNLFKEALDAFRFYVSITMPPTYKEQY